MKIKNWATCVLAVVCAIAASSSVVAWDDKPNDSGKGPAFKNAVFQIKEQGEVALVAKFAADKEVVVTTNGNKETDVHLFVYDGDNKEVAKDTTPGPKCEVKFTPQKEGTYKLLVKNEGPGKNNVMLDVKSADGSDKPTDGDNASPFKIAVFELKEQGEVTVLSSFPAGRDVTVTANGEKQTDVHLFINERGNKEVGKDTSPGPKCEVKFTPQKDGRFKLLVKNEGPGTNIVTLQANIAD